MRVILFHKKSGLEARSSEGTLFVRLFEKGEDDKFKMKEGITVNLSAQELGELGLLLFTVKGSAKFIHKVGDTAKTIQFEAVEDDNGRRSIMVTVQSGDRRIAFAMTKGEAYVLWRLVNNTIDEALRVEENRGQQPNQAEGADSDAQPATTKGNSKKGRKKKEEPEELPF